MEFQCLTPTSMSATNTSAAAITMSDPANIINDANVLSFPINLDDNLLHLPAATAGAGAGAGAGQQVPQHNQAI